MQNNHEASMIRAIIVDDEEKSRKLLKNLLADYCAHVEVVAMAHSVSSAINAIQRSKPDLIFLDIIMPDENGFRLLEMIKDIDIEVIFVTAYDQYAIKAIRFSALDYLLKPINIDDLHTAIRRVEEKILLKRDEQAFNKRLHVFLENSQLQPHQKKIGLPTQTGINFVIIEDILLCRAEGNYSIIYLSSDGRKEIITRTLKDFEELLTDYNFYRVHRSYLINLSHIKEYSRTNQSPDYDGDGGCVIMSNNMKIPVSREKRKALIERFARPF